MTSRERDSAPPLPWIGLTRRESFDDVLLEFRDRLANAGRAGDWPTVLDVVRGTPGLVNTWRPGGSSWFTPLHHAADHGAPKSVVRELVKLGAWRTLRTASGERATDIATRRGHASLARLLEPEARAPIDDAALRALEAQFHAVIRSRSAHQIDNLALRLPELGPMTERAVGQAFWFPVPGMFGGFRYWLEHAGDHPKLLSESWCRIVGGSGERHAITREGSVLLAAGFV